MLLLLFFVSMGCPSNQNSCPETRVLLPKGRHQAWKGCSDPVLLQDDPKTAHYRGADPGWRRLLGRDPEESGKGAPQGPFCVPPPGRPSSNQCFSITTSLMYQISHKNTQFSRVFGSSFLKTAVPYTLVNFCYAFLFQFFCFCLLAYGPHNG